MLNLSSLKGPSWAVGLSRLRSCYSNRDEQRSPLSKAAGKFQLPVDYAAHHRALSCDRRPDIPPSPHTENCRRGHLPPVTFKILLPRNHMLARYMLSSCVRLSVCLSQAGMYRNDWTNRAGFIRKFGYLQKSGYFPLGLCPKLRTFLFRHGKSIALSTKLVVIIVNCRVCWQHLYDSRRVVTVYKSIDCNPLNPLLRFVVHLLYNLFVQRSVCGSRASCCYG